MPETYFAALGRFAFRRSLAVTDGLSILVGVLIPAISRVSGKAAAEDFAGYAAWAVILCVVSLIILRLVTAQYFIWREQNKKIAELESELAKPEQSVKARMHDDIATARIALLDQLMRIHERVGRKAYNPSEYYKSLIHEGAAIPAEKLTHDETFAQLWKAHTELRGDAERYADSSLFTLRVGFDRVDKSHQRGLVKSRVTAIKHIPLSLSL